MFKKRIISTFSGFNIALLADTKLPALLKALSDGVEVAGVHKRFLATFAMRTFCAVQFPPI